MSDPGSISWSGRAMGKPPELETTPFQSSTTKPRLGWKRLSLARQKPIDDDEDAWGAYGLNLLHDPSRVLIDLIFVHGLRGGSIKTWCKGDDSTFFWPQAWLPGEQGFQNARIHSFGYNADWADMKDTALDLHDFGRALLTEMKTSPFLRKRETPIILIGHSMGGLVIKKAYLLAQQDPNHHSLSNRIRCMFFLATPHRGSDSAKLLNNVLRASTVFSSRQYITDILKGSPSLQTINDEFRAFTGKVELWSFYETIKTRTGVTSSILIVDRDSAVLGYQGETAQPLNADHRSICKFDSQKDPNYVTIRNALSKAIEDLLADDPLEKTEETKLQIRDIEAFLMISHDVDDDLITAEASKTEGTCEWAINLESFKDWRDSSSETPMIYWLTGEPGSGKTTVATHITRHLQSRDADTCFHFFHHGQKAHQSISGLLRHVAFQMALHQPAVRHRLHAMQKTGAVFDKDDERTVWRRLFMNEIFDLPLPKPQYWIIDGLDECVDSSKLFVLIAKFSPAFPLRICFIGRKRPDFERHFSLLEPRLSTHQIDPVHTQQDIASYIRDNATMLPVDKEDSGPLIDKIIKKSQGNFLWAKLALEELEKVYSDESVDDVLDELPQGMASIYRRVLDMMATNAREIKLTKAILTWVVCGARSLSILELQASLKLDLTMTIRNMERTVEGLCGQLLRIDKAKTVQVVHTTVRDFLLDSELESPLAIQTDQGHQQLALVCLRYLVSDEMRPPRHRLLLQSQPSATSEFADYACTLFSEHVIKSSMESDEIPTLLYKFFQTNVLTWVEGIARNKHDLFYVIRTARNLRQYIERRVKYAPAQEDRYEFIEKWTLDLIRIVAKFSRNLLEFPSAIFYLVAPLCPADSAIFLQFNGKGDSLKLSGRGHSNWDDCVSYIDYRGVRALSLAAADNAFAIGQRTGRVKVYDAATCQEIADLDHGEPAKFLKFNNSGERLLVSGSHRLNMFSVDGALLWTFSHRDAVAAAGFSVADDIVIITTRGSSVLHLSAAHGVVMPGESLGREECRQLKSTAHQAILHADISPDLSMIAIAYRGRPVQLWSLERDACFGICWFKRDTPGLPCASVSEVLFNRNPAVELLAVASQDGELAIFDPWTRQEITSVSGEAYTLACAPDGRTLATGDTRGTIKLWDFATLTLLYCIKSDDHDVRSLAFSGDGFRLYDIREGKTKVWEPAALIRKSLSDDWGAAESIIQPVTVVDRRREAPEIICMVAMGTEQLVLVGREDGSVVLFDTVSAELQQSLYSHSHSLMITHVSWSPAGYIASADASSVAQLWVVSKDADNTIRADRKVMEVEVSSSIRNIALSPSGSKLLVCEASSDSLYWVMPTKTTSPPKVSTIDSFGCARRTWAWLPQPVAEWDIAMVSDSTLYLYRTNDTTRDISLKARAALTYGGSEIPVPAQKLTLTTASRFLAAHLENTKEPASPKLLVYSLEYIKHETEGGPDDSLGTLEPLLCLSNKMMRMFIGWCDHVLVFLDTDLWICSIDVTSIGKGQNKTYTRRRHLFIPYELIGSNNGVALVLASGASIVFPREGWLSIIAGALSFAFMSDEIVG